MNNKIPPKPEKPTPNECCGSGCNPCIFDYYYTQLEKWQEKYQSASEQLAKTEYAKKSEKTE